MTTKVKVSNISSKASGDAVAKFFSFCGKITKLSMTREDGNVEAIIEFDTADAAKTALLLTHAWIEDQPITVEAFTGDVPQATPQHPEGTTGDVDAETTPDAATDSEPVTERMDGEEVPNKDFAVPDAERTSTSVIASMLAGGYTLGVGALDAAKELDERNRITQTMSDTMQIARENIARLDEQYSISQRASDLSTSIGGALSSFDSQYGVSERTSMAAGAVADGASRAGQSISQAASTMSESAMANPTFANTYNSVTTTLGNIAGAVAGAVAPPLRTASDALGREVDDIKHQTQEKIDAQQKQRQEAARATMDDSDSVASAFSGDDEGDDEGTAAASATTSVPAAAPEHPPADSAPAAAAAAEGAADASAPGSAETPAPSS